MKKLKKGDLLSIKVEGLGFGFALIIKSGTIVFYDLILKNIPEASSILNSSILFHSYFAVEKWSTLNNFKLIERIKIEREKFEGLSFFRADIFNKGKFLKNSMYDEEAISVVPIQGIGNAEMQILWDINKVEERFISLIQGQEPSFYINSRMRILNEAGVYDNDDSFSKHLKRLNNFILEGNHKKARDYIKMNNLREIITKMSLD